MYTEENGQDDGDRDEGKGGLTGRKGVDAMIETAAIIYAILITALVILAILDH